MLFKDVPIMGYFFDDYYDLCQKVGETEAVTPFCAPGWTAGFRPDEQVTLAIPEPPPKEQP